MSDQRDKADALEQRYVAEHAEDEQLVEGLDPEKPREDQTVDQVAAGGDGAGEELEQMARDDP